MCEGGLTDPAEAEAGSVRLLRTLNPEGAGRHYFYVGSSKETQWQARVIQASVSRDTIYRCL